MWYTKADGTAVVSSTARTLLSTLTMTSGATQSATGLTPASYRWYEIECNGVSCTTTTDTMRMATSGNAGANYGTPVSFGQTLAAATDTWDGLAWLYNINVALQFGPAGLGSVGRSSDGLRLLTTLVTIGKNATGGTGPVDAIQFSLSAAATFDAGTIKIYGIP
jgi:hypothetical protein